MKKKCKSFCIRTASVFILLLILISCSKNKNDVENDNNATDENVVEQDANKIFFSGMNWLVGSEEPEFIVKGKYATCQENVFVDDEGKLHLILKIIDDEPVGAEITVDSLLDLGEYIFFLDTKLSTFPQNCELLFRFTAPYEISGVGLAETGIAIGFENSKIKNPIKYYAFNTASRTPEKHYVKSKYGNDANGTIYKAILVNEAITFVSLRASSDKENSQTRASLISEYTFSEFNRIKGKNELTFFRPNRKQKLTISLNCFDANRELEEFEVVISKIVCKTSAKVVDFAAINF